MASVSHVDQEQLDRRQMSKTVGDTVFGVPGVTAQTDNKRVGTSFNIRGLQDFGRVAVIVDGARQNFQRSGHGSQSVAFIDPELPKGRRHPWPGRQYLWLRAIGGVVFMETKDAEDFLRPAKPGRFAHGPL